MKSPSAVLQFLMLLLHSSYTVAAPIVSSRGSIQHRAGIEFAKRNNRNSPIDATFNVAGWQDIAEEDCYVMLCRYGGERVWQRIATGSVSDTHYVESGASLIPFRSDNLSDRQTRQIDPTTTSAEEFPWRSIDWNSIGGPADVLPATTGQQSSQGSGINTGYQRSEVNYGDWFRITFQNYDSSKVYCPALFADSPDFSACDKRTTVFAHNGINLADFDYLKVSGSNPIVFSHPK